MLLVDRITSSASSGRITSLSSEILLNGMKQTAIIILNPNNNNNVSIHNDVKEERKREKNDGEN